MKQLNESIRFIFKKRKGINLQVEKNNLSNYKLNAGVIKWETNVKEAKINKGVRQKWHSTYSCKKGTDSTKDAR